MLLSVEAAGAVDEGTTVRILFTSNSNGKLMDCNCRNDPYGGLAERVSLVRDYRSRHADMLLLDAGGYLGLTDVDRKAPRVFALMNLMGYDAWGVGDQELYRGLEKFVLLLGDDREKVVSASIRNRKGEDAFTPYKIFTVGSVRIAVTGIAAPETFAFSPKDAIDFTWEKPEETLKKLLPELRRRADYVVVLSQMGYDVDRGIAGKILGIDLIIGSHSQTLLEREVKEGSCRIVQAGKNGGRVGEVTLAFDGKRTMKRFSYRLVAVDKTYKIPSEVIPIVDFGRN